MAEKQYKLDIKEVLGNIDRKNYSWFSNLSEEEQKAFEPFVIMQFMSAGSNNIEDEYFLEMTNEVLNKGFTYTSLNKELFYRLCCVCGTGNKSFHKFIRPVKNKKSDMPNLERFFTELYESDFKKNELILLYKINKDHPKSHWEDYAESLDWKPDDIKNLLKEVKKLKSMFL